MLSYNALFQEAPKIERPSAGKILDLSSALVRDPLYNDRNTDSALHVPLDFQDACKRQSSDPLRFMNIYKNKEAKILLGSMKKPNDKPNSSRRTHVDTEALQQPIVPSLIKNVQRLDRSRLKPVASRKKEQAFATAIRVQGAASTPQRPAVSLSCTTASNSSSMASLQTATRDVFPALGAEPLATSMLNVTALDEFEAKESKAAYTMPVESMKTKFVVPFSSVPRRASCTISQSSSSLSSCLYPKTEAPVTSLPDPKSVVSIQPGAVSPIIISAADNVLASGVSTVSQVPRFTPIGLGLKLAAEVNRLDELNASIQQLADLEALHQLSATQADTLTLAQLMKVSLSTSIP